MPIFGVWNLWYLYKTGSTGSGIVGWFGLLTCFLAPFVYGRSLLKTKWETYRFDDIGVCVVGTKKMVKWNDVVCVREAKLGYHHSVRLELEETSFSFPVYSEIASQLEKIAKNQKAEQGAALKSDPRAW